jgi:hypothetical protein
MTIEENQEPVVREANKTTKYPVQFVDYDVPEGFIKDFATMLNVNITDGNPYWHLSVAEAIGATPCWDVKIPNRKGNGEKALRPMPFRLAIGPSGESVKTVPFKNYAIPTIQKFQNLYGKEKKFLMSEITSERCVNAMNWHEDKEYDEDLMKEVSYWTISNVGIITKEEFTSFIKGASSKDYQCDSLEVLCEIYDGRLNPRETNKYGFKSVEFCAKTLLSLTTPYIYELLTPPFFISGTGPRIDPDTSGWNVKKDNNKTEEEKNQDRINFFKVGDFDTNNPLDKFAERMLAMSKSPPKHVFPDDESAILWGKYFDFKREKIHGLPESSLLRNYLQEMQRRF